MMLTLRAARDRLAQFCILVMECAPHLLLGGLGRGNCACNWSSGLSLCSLLHLRVVSRQLGVQEGI